MKQKNEVKWGVLGCGHIAQTFMKSIEPVANTQVIACASTSAERAQLFASKYTLEYAYDDYQSLIDNPLVDAVYIANTHNAHYLSAAACLAAGKAVLCEKPLTVNGNQAKRLFALAREHNVLLVEAMWTRFLPAIRQLKHDLQSGVIGDINSVQANFSFNGHFDDTHRLKNMQTAGGALLDLGIYPLTLADIVFETDPVEVSGNAKFCNTGVDESNNLTLVYSGERYAKLSSSFASTMPTEAKISGTKGYIEIPNFLAAQNYIVYTKAGKTKKEYPFRYGREFSAQIEEFIKSLNTGEIECPLSSKQHTLRALGIMDELRHQWHFNYPAHIEST
ncbi:Gfo/Idh/MocA family protein [Alteromonas facilis]|uniref:Gfo/Idh/MocA family protein n=1 Tax=Alteromonas facilis TaxID=2048004 RepID=UPI000C2958CA|nr:Gfo/Idh/MocA family oxidoreductase [Alteromonas facilis]